MKFLFNFIKIDWILPRVLISALTFYFLKTAFWPLTYLFVVSYVMTILLLVIKIDWDFKFREFIVDFKLPVLLAGIIILEFLFRNQFSITIVRKDILLLLLLFSLFYFLYWRKSIIDEEILKSFFLNLLIIVIASISILNIFSQISHVVLPPEILIKLNISTGLTIANDYNYFCLFLLFGLVIINYKFKNSVLYYRLPQTTTLFLSFILILNIVISGSRRAFLVLIILSIIKIFYYFFSKRNSINIKNIWKSTIEILLISILFSFFGFITLRIIPKQNIRNLAFRYSTLTGIDNLRITEKFLWKREPEIPVGKNYLIDKTSFDVNAKYWNNLYAPATSIAFINTCFGKSIQVTRGIGSRNGFSLQYVGPDILYYANHTYKISFKIKFIDGNFDSFNVGWWVNDGKKGFPNTAALKKVTEPIGGGWYNCISEYTFIDNHFSLTGFFNSVADYTSFLISDFELIDLDFDPRLPRYVFEVKGKENLAIWLNTHNLPFSGENLISNGNFERGSTFWKCTTDSSINIKIENLDNIKCALVTRADGNGGDWSLFNVGRPIEYKANNEYQIAFKILLVKPKTIPFKVGFWVDEGEGVQYNLKLRIDTLKNGWLDVKTSYIFKNNQYNLLFLINSQISNSQFYITDISLLNLTQKQHQIDSNNYMADIIKSESLFSERTSRWLYVIELWKTKFTLQNKLFGHGFDYLEWYGKKFLQDEKGTSYDWPHNPFISVLLYSGVIGLLFYVLLLIKVVSLYYKYRKQYGIAFIGFLITFFFSFFSGSTPFDPPIMGFFMLLPFFLHSIQKNKIQPIYEKLANDKDINHGEK